METLLMERTIVLAALLLAILLIGVFTVHGERR
jgi:hypothetical protein